MGVVSRKTNKENDLKSSSTSVSDEQLEGEGPLTPIDKMEDDVVDEDDDDLSALNSLLQAGSAGSLSDEEHEEEEEEEADSASPLSSLPDDFPLSRSASPENQTTTTSTAAAASNTNLRKRKKSVDTKKNEETSNTPNNHNSTKRAKSEEVETNAMEQTTTNTSVHEELMSSSKRRRVSRTTLEISEATRTLRRTSKQEEKQVSPKIPIEEEGGKTESNAIEKKESSHNEVTLNKEEDKNEEIPSAIAENVEKKEEKEQTQPEPQPRQGDDESEIQGNDDQDYQQRHKEALDALTQIEVEFARLRDKMYQEKMSELNEEAIMIANGTHPELVSLMTEIEEKKGNRIQSAESWRRYQHDNFKKQFEGFEYQANIHFISQKNALRRTLLNDLNGKKWSIEDERSKFTKQDRIIPDANELNTYKKEQKEETDELQDIKEVIGFPMAPNPSGLSIQDIDEDLKLLGLYHH